MFAGWTREYYSCHLAGIPLPPARRVTALATRQHNGGHIDGEGVTATKAQWPWRHTEGGTFHGTQGTAPWCALAIADSGRPLKKSHGYQRHKTRQGGTPGGLWNVGFVEGLCGLSMPAEAQSLQKCLFCQCNRRANDSEQPHKCGYGAGPRKYATVAYRTLRVQFAAGGSYHREGKTILACARMV